MPEAAEDRRVRRTRSRLKASLLELLEAKDYDAITVEDIAQQADVGRSTFYSHFESKEDLLFSGFDSWVVSLAEDHRDGPLHAAAPSAEEPRFRFSLPLLHHLRSQERLFRAFFLRGQSPSARRRLVSVLTETVRRELGDVGPRDASSPRGASKTRGEDLEHRNDGHAHAIAWAFVGVVMWWLESGRALSAEAVDRVFQGAVRRARAPESPGR
jgi:AcrR family transcriptional regulator